MSTLFPRCVPRAGLAGILFCAAAAFAAGTNDGWLMRPWQTEDGLR